MRLQLSKESTSSSSGHSTWVGIFSRDNGNRLIVTGNNIGHPILNGVVKPELKEAIAKIFTACKKADKKCGIFSVGGDQAKIFADQGFDMINVATDYTTLEFAMKLQLTTATGAARPTKGGSY